jgi:hypothetical protein
MLVHRKYPILEHYKSEVFRLGILSLYFAKTIQVEGIIHMKVESEIGKAQSHSVPLPLLLTPQQKDNSRARGN